MIRKKFLILFALLGISLFIFAFFLTSVLLNGQVSQQGDQEFEINSSYSYRYIEYDPETNSKEYGLVELPRKLGEFEYETYDFQSERHSHRVLISNFDSPTYICNGGCTCYEDYERRTSSVLGRFSTKLTTLLVASSSLMASKLAKEYFEDLCVLQQEGEKSDLDCFAEDIQSYFEGCDEERSDHHMTRIKKQPNQEEEEEGDQKKYRFLCGGNCQDTIQLERVPRKLVKMIRCESMKTENEVFVTEQLNSQKRINDDDRMIQIAKFKFQEDYLVPFCRENSVREYYYSVERKLKTQISICQARPKLKKGKELVLNKSVQCVPL